MLLGKTFEEYQIEMARYELPIYMAEAVFRYLEHRIPPGGFLSAVISNDLCGAIARADDNNRDALYRWVGMVYNEFPDGAWGTPEKLKAWVNPE